MDWKTLFLSADGRIGRQSFWIAILILIGVNVVLGWIPLIGALVGLALIYPSVCVYSKRLHDMGKSGWLQVWPIAICVVLFIVAGVSVGGAAAMGAFSGSDDLAAGAAMGGMGMMAISVGLAFVIAIGFLLWLGLTPSEAGANKYGEPPIASPLPAA